MTKFSKICCYIVSNCFFRDFVLHKRHYRHGSAECNTVKDVSKQKKDISGSSSHRFYRVSADFKKICSNSKRINPKNAGRWSQLFDPPLVVFLVSSKERVKPCFLWILKVTTFLKISLTLLKSFRRYVDFFCQY